MGDKMRNSNQQPEMTEAIPSNPHTTSPTHSRKPSLTPTPGAKKLVSSQPSSNTASPRPSREASPARPTVRPATVRTGNGRARKSGSQEPSPSRSASAAASNVPSSTAVQRALTAANTPLLKPSSSDPAIIAPQPQKVTIPTETRDAPRWPISPRLRSPPPINRPTGMPRKQDQELPPISTLRFQSSNESTQSTNTDTDNDESSAMSGMRSPGRGNSTSATTLETVPEISQPSTPAIGLEGSREWKLGGLPEEQNAIDQAFTKNMKSSAAAGMTDSGSDSGEKKGEIKLRPTSTGANSASRPNLAQVAKPGSTTAVITGKKGTEPSATNSMTVETETVSSIPQVAVGGGTGTGVNGSLRTKPSSETIRPKKEKKKSARKPHSVTSGVGEQPDSSSSRPPRPPRLHHHTSLRSVSDTSGSVSPSESSRPATAQGRFPSPSPTLTTLSDFRLPSLRDMSKRLTNPRAASSKADIFEAKIAIAVDEANSSDSEETFVYESNPPDHERPRRFHSRTPSTTSMASQSQTDSRHGLSRLASTLDGSHGHTVAMKKSMKFASSFQPPPSDAATDDDSQRAMGTGRGTIRHHHIGRWGRNNSSNAHPSLFDAESPFPLATKPSKFSGTASSRQSSRPSSPRLANMKPNGRKNGYVPAYDIDDGAGADDERTPLISSGMRSTRSRHRRNAAQPQLRDHHPTRTAFSACLIFILLLALVLLGAATLLLATTQPLGEVRIVALRDVLASKTELLLDVDVVARNPNVFAVGVERLDVSVYAKSKFAGDSDWAAWRYGRPDGTGTGTATKRRMRYGTRIVESDVDVAAHDGLIPRDDSPWDPYPPPPSDTPLLLLGRLTSHDTGLSFPASPFRHTPSLSTAALRLGDPGNSTEGRRKWERVIGREWELIVQGVVEYGGGLGGLIGGGGGRKKSVPVGGSVVVGGGGEDEVGELGV